MATIRCPSACLRPPPGWPDEFKGALTALPSEEQRIIGLLYDADESGKITYLDIYELLRKELAGRDVPNAFCSVSHGPEQNEDGLLKEAVRRIVEGWPPPPFRIAGRDEGGKRGGPFGFDPPKSPAALSEKRFEGALRKCGVHAGRGPAVYRRQVTSSQRTVETVLPNARDRRIPRCARSLDKRRSSTEASYRSEGPGHCEFRSCISIWMSVDR